MCDLQAIVDRFEIETLWGEFTDAGMMRDYDRFAGLFTVDGTWRVPHAGFEFSGRARIRAAIEQLNGVWEYFVQNVHPGTVRLDGDTAAGRVYIAEFGRMRNGQSHSNYAVYHDGFRRTSDGWRFAERVYEVRYVDDTPLVGSAPPRTR